MEAGSVCISLYSHTKQPVTVAIRKHQSMAQLVNVIAPIMTRTGGGVWAQTIYWPLMQASRFGRGTALRPVVESPVYSCKDFDAVPVLDATAVLGEDGAVTLFAVNRDLTEDVLLEVDMRAFGTLRPVEHSVLHHGLRGRISVPTQRFAFVFPPSAQGRQTVSKAHRRLAPSIPPPFGTCRIGPAHLPDAANRWSARRCRTPYPPADRGYPAGGKASAWASTIWKPARCSAPAR